MGVRGPVPKRTTQRRRRNAPAIPVTTPPRGTRSGKVARPATPKGWHPTAKRFYEALAKSGQSHYYEPSDWALAYLVAESMSRDLNPQVVAVIQEGKHAGEIVKESIPLKGASLAAYLRACAVLGVAEGDRRRLSIELEAPAPTDPDEEAADAAILDMTSRIGG